MLPEFYGNQKHPDIPLSAVRNCQDEEIQKDESGHVKHPRYLINFPKVVGELFRLHITTDIFYTPFEKLYVLVIEKR